MLTVHSYERIRHAYVVEGKSIRQIGREYGHGYWTVRKVGLSLNDSSRFNPSYGLHALRA